MTILPKKKTSHQQNSAENNDEKANSAVIHGNQLSHHQQLSSNHIQQSVGSPSVREDCGALSPRPPASHYDDDRTSGASSPAAAASVAVVTHSKRRSTYRASPLRSVRPKLREHRVGGGTGGATPPYPPATHPHSLPLTPLSSSALPPLPPLSPQAGPSSCAKGETEEDSNSGYNSGDEYQPMNWNLTPQEWAEKERWFEKKMKKKGLIIKKMREDGACLFRAIADQVYGDQDMHDIVRQHCMDYLAANEDTFSPFVSEDFQTYVNRKRQLDVFGNHIEIAAMSEMYNRIIEVYCYSTEPINIFQSSSESSYPCIRLSYHCGTHYNGLVDPFNPSCGVGLGLPNLVPGLADANLMKEATRQSENFHIEQAMLEDKIRATDFEATVEAIEEQVANESYLDYLRDLDRRNKAQHRVGSASSSSSSSVSCQSSQAGLAADHSTVPRPSDTRSPPPPSAHPSHSNPRASPPYTRTSPPHRSSPPLVNCRSSPPRISSRSGTGSREPYASGSSGNRDSLQRGSPRGVGASSPKSKNGSLKKADNDADAGVCGCTASTSTAVSDLAVPGSSKDPMPSRAATAAVEDFSVNERASFLNQLPLDVFGLSDYSREEFDVLARVLAASQQEYLDSLKRNKDNNNAES